MNLKSLAVAVVVSSAIYPGCKAVEYKVGSTTVGSPAKSGLAEEPTLTFAAKPKKKVTLEIDNGACTATFDEHPNGTLKKGTLAVTAGASTGTCEVQETEGPESILINGKPVVDIGPAQFTTEGSCRYCYVNSTGGMSCVVYNVPRCPR